MSSNFSRTATPLSPSRWALYVWGILLCLYTGCGYQFTVQGPGPVVGGDSDVTTQGPPVRLAMQTFKNNTFEPNLEFKYARYLRQAMQSTGGAEFVDDGYADYVLEGAILSVLLPSTAFSRTQTQESRVVVRVAVSIKDQKTGKILWSQMATSTAPFFIGATSLSGASSGLQFNRVLQDRAIEQAGQFVTADLADRFVWARDQGLFQRHEKNGDSAPITDNNKTQDISGPQEDPLSPNSLIE